MNDVTGMPQSALVIGGGSDLGLAIVRLFAKRRLHHVVLAGRDLDALGNAADALRATSSLQVDIAHLDVLDIEHLDDQVTASMDLLSEGVDLVIVAAGVLDTSPLAELDARAVNRSVSTNFTGPAAVLVSVARRLIEQGYGRMLVLSSVAAVRVRAANFLYGSSKLGLDGFCQGLSDVLVGSGVELTIVRPGFVHTKMTEGRPAAPFAVDERRVAADVVRGIERQTAVIWSPPLLGAVFGVLKLLPRALWRKVPG
jgi:decaprenylphospho-beta-D-erythro-pentofuranosid-2-ulose 2-reductase